MMDAFRRKGLPKISVRTICKCRGSVRQRKEEERAIFWTNGDERQESQAQELGASPKSGLGGSYVGAERKKSFRRPRVAWNTIRREPRVQSLCALDKQAETYSRSNHRPS